MVRLSLRYCPMRNIKLRWLSNLVSFYFRMCSGFCFARLIRHESSRIFKGCRGKSPCRSLGCPQKPFPCSRRRRRRREEKKAGSTQTPARGWPPLATPLLKQLPKIRDDSCLLTFDDNGDIEAPGRRYWLFRHAWIAGEERRAGKAALHSIKTSLLSGRVAGDQQRAGGMWIHGQVPGRGIVQSDPDIAAVDARFKDIVSGAGIAVENDPEDIAAAGEKDGEFFMAVAQFGGRRRGFDGVGTVQRAINGEAGAAAIVHRWGRSGLTHRRPSRIAGRGRRSSRRAGRED